MKNICAMVAVALISITSVADNNPVEGMTFCENVGPSPAFPGGGDFLHCKSFNGDNEVIDNANAFYGNADLGAPDTYEVSGNQIEILSSDNYHREIYTLECQITDGQSVFNAMP